MDDSQNFVAQQHSAQQGLSLGSEEQAQRGGDQRTQPPTKQMEAITKEEVGEVLKFIWNNEFEIKSNPGCWLPQTLFEHPSLKDGNGRADLPSILLLGHIIYWHRPIDNKGYCAKKFQDDALQLSYAQFASRFSLTNLQAKRAFKLLKKRGLIKTQLRTIDVRGLKLSNVQYVTLVLDTLNGVLIPTPSIIESTEGSTSIYPSM